VAIRDRPRPPEADRRRPDLAAARVLVAESRPALAELLALGLRAHGLAAAVAQDGHEALAAVSTWLPDFLLVDARLNGLSGLEVARRVRAAPGPRIGILVAAREHDRLRGFAAGADDEMLKPLALDEMVARVRAILARCRAGSTELEPALTFGDVTIDVARRRVERAGRVVDLRRREFDLLVFLVRHPGQAFTREELTAQVWRAPGAVGLSTVTVHMRRLRARLEQDPSRPRWLETVWGVGYRFRP
jgi:DNA-binding response OmpR family regulator